MPLNVNEFIKHETNTGSKENTILLVMYKVECYLSDFLCISQSTCTAYLIHRITNAISAVPVALLISFSSFIAF